MICNVDLLLKVADKIEEFPELYDQCVFAEKTHCGTAHCVAGWAIAIARPWLMCDDGTIFRDVDPAEEGRSLLGISRKNANRLFEASWKPKPGYTVPQALRILTQEECDLEEVTDPVVVEDWVN